MVNIGIDRCVFSSVNDSANLREAIELMTTKSINSLFGIRFTLRNRNIETHLITSPSVRIGNRVSIRSIVSVSRAFETYEGYLSKPSFLPLYTEKVDGLRHHLTSLSKSLLPNDKVVFQIIFHRMSGYEWKENLIEMYHSYLKGNNSPVYHSLGRALQDKANEMLNRLGNFHSTRDCIPEAEDKILGVGYDFQLAIGIHSIEDDVILGKITNIFREYDSYNSIKLNKVDSEDDSLNLGNIISFSSGKRISSSTVKQLLSEKEMFALLVGSDEVVDVISNTPSLAEFIPVSNSDIFNILPRNPLPDNNTPSIDEKDLVNRVAEALKRVKIMPIARLYNESVTEGVRLITVQFDIPKDKNISQLQSKRIDIQAALGIQPLSIEQGDSPDTVKIVLPNTNPSAISLREIIELDSFHKFRKKEGNDLSFVAGIDEIGNPIYLSLSKLVHLLVAGTTGSGKSVFLNTLIVSLLATHTPEELQMIMIDPKMVELQHYDQFPHVREVITNMTHAERTLSQLTVEMDNRYIEFQKIGVKNIQFYNSSDNRENLMPYIVCVVDEYADLKDLSIEDVEAHIGRLGQKARAAGIHMIIATQRPDVKVLSGRIKAVIPNAVSFNLNNNNDYRTVFGTGIGGFALLGKGDGLMKIEGSSKTFQRFQSCMVSVDEKKEAKVYKNLAKYYNGDDVKYERVRIEEVLEEEISLIKEEDDDLEKLKKIIANTKETRMAPLRKELSIRAETLTDLMRALVDEGWLIKHDSKAKGYELVVNEEELDKWK